jgi:hypothetical protein
MDNSTSPVRPSQHSGAFPRCTSIDQEEILTHGLKLQAEFNTMCAVEYLKSCDVETEVIRMALQRAIGSN